MKVCMYYVCGIYACVWVSMYVLMYACVCKYVRIHVLCLFHSCTMHFDAIKVFYLPIDAQ
jgi:hypothetical protein